MPTVFVIDGFRFFFYSNEGSGPPHIHVERGSGSAKWWLTPVSIGWNDGLKPPEVRKARRIIGENEERLIKARHDYFNG